MYLSFEFEFNAQIQNSFFLNCPGIYDILFTKSYEVKSFF